MLNFTKSVLVFCLLMLLLLFSCKEKKENEKPENKVENVMQEGSKITFIKDEANKKIDVNFNGELFTSYVFDGKTPKPILYPLITKSGKTLTRGFPYSPRPNERVDHPHHVGLWLNYGDVNGFDFWNNSYAIKEQDKHKYGTIMHQKIIDSNDKNGTLRVAAVWRTPDDVDLLEELTEFRFSGDENTRIIDRRTTLKALDEVSFKDNKEGMIGIRVARELELPTNKPAVYTDAKGNVTEVKTMNNKGVMGNYLSSEELTGNDVWGTRNKWVKLESSIEEEVVSITILDNKKNVGYPTYWHARDYGLFAANPLGQAVFSEGKETLDFKLKKGESVTFNYRILVHNGSELSTERLNRFFDDFNN